jgi:hypothetical protein
LHRNGAVGFTEWLDASGVLGAIVGGQFFFLRRRARVELLTKIRRLAPSNQDRFW